jgi:hypothetical protein
MLLHEVQECGSERIAEQGIVEMFYMTPKGFITRAPLREQYMNVRIPFQVPAESVKHTNKSGRKILGFVHVTKHSQNHITHRMKQTVQQISVSAEI